DYWENSYKQGIRWIEANYDHPPDKRLRIGAGSQNARYALDPNRYEFVEVPENIDLYLSTTRDDRHKMVPCEIVHTIQRDSVALFYIIRPDDSFDQDPSFTPSTQRHITLANQYDRSRNEKEAFQHYQEALSQDPDNPNVLANLGRHYLLQNKYQDAVPYLERALELQPNYLNAYLHLGTAFHALGQTQKAAKIYLKTIALKPNLREPYVNLAIILIEMERWLETVKLLTEATKIHTAHPKIWQMLAQAYRQLGDLAKADDSISRAFQLNPSEYSVQEEYALVAADYQNQNQLVRAGTIYQNILERNPEMPGAAFNLGLLYYKQNQFLKAIAAYEQAVSHFPKDPNPLLAMSLALNARGTIRGPYPPVKKPSA
ncbi:MAG: tetratricopeptide repeat protein, partial [bacterium]|nr:tetratricopeptide repeat protein [bacterium]